MKIDVISIFPEFLNVLDLSLIGRAQQDGLLQINRTNLRDFTTDKHRSVDDTPTGGGAGMVMRPEPWAQALESLLPQQPAEEQDQRPTLIIPSPAGEVFTQRTAEELASEEHLIFAPGRFEGIDERVTQWAQENVRVRPMSIGDYVLNGGEAAVVVMLEAITRLIPGVIGNAESLAEESHSDEGLLEYPVYTKPAQWRGLAVPEVLLSGDHAKIANWRRNEQLQRTRRRRPDLWAKYVVAQEHAER